MDPESLQIDFEWACNLEQSHGSFNFGDSCLILGEPASVCTLSEFTFEVSQSPVQLVDTTNVQPSVKARREANDRNQHRDDRNDEEHDSVEERGKPERGVPLPKGRTRSVKRLCRWRKGQIIGLFGREFTETIEGARFPVNFAHGFEQQRGAYRALPSRRTYIPKAGWPAAPTRGRGPGGQDRPAGGGRGAQRDLRGRFPRVLVRISTGAVRA
jgi:hypothetical protein